jgi:hypothetical protein
MLIVSIWIEKRIAVTGGDQFRTAFAAGVWIVSSHDIRFPIFPHPFTVFIAFIAGLGTDESYLQQIGLV